MADLWLGERLPHFGRDGFLSPICRTSFDTGYDPTLEAMPVGWRPLLLLLALRSAGPS